MKKKSMKNNLMGKIKKSKFSWDKHGSFISLGIIIVILAVIIGVWYGTKQNKKGRKFFDVDAKARVGMVEGGANFEFFDNSINSQTPTLAVWYAKWCGHCKNAMPQFEELKNRDIKDRDGNKVDIRLMDGDENNEEREKDGVTGFPTILLHKNGETKTYNGERTADDIENFINNN